ncbi:hypothetical protein SI65_09945 [Aspergillus cristatus]|uniref:Carnitinyl-CoA dehydratase n=1 Tax=Aspergillus cristatus TaxID=573508 RepID=A0A1E3B0X3_ASPCR|nr:hypothetical protein SI65_09945 [Aspergillus cristatus]
MAPPSSNHFILSFPKPHILLVTINRPKQRNSVPSDAHWDAHTIFSWFDNEPSLLVAIITGAGDKAFCAGQDLTEQSQNATAKREKGGTQQLHHPPTGFLGLSQRKGKKPVLAAVNGFALGGGFETCLNCDMIVASPTATFGLPEITVGLYAAAGGLPRLAQITGLPLASELALTARRLSAQEALDYRLINRISESPVEECVKLAETMEKFSPDAVIVTRQGLREAWETGSVEEAGRRTKQEYGEKLFRGENFRIGVQAFAKKEKPRWVASKL